MRITLPVLVQAQRSGFVDAFHTIPSGARRSLQGTWRQAFQLHGLWWIPGPDGYRATDGDSSGQGYPSWLYPYHYRSTPDWSGSRCHWPANQHSGPEADGDPALSLH